jgi:hypothetical protein
VVKGNTVQFTAVVDGVDGTQVSQAVTWTIDQTDRHADTVISADGLLTVSTDETAEILTVRARAVQNNTKTAAAEVNVYDPPEVISVTVMPQTIAVTRRFPVQFAAIVTVSGNPSKAVTWSVVKDGGTLATGTSIAADGKLTVSESELVGGILTVTAASTFAPSVTGSASARVAAWATPPDSLVNTWWKWDGSEWDRTLFFDTSSHLYFDNYHTAVSGAVYHDAYTYNYSDGTGTITGGYPAGAFMLLDENQIMYFPNYKNYGHGAQFRRINEPGPPYNGAYYINNFSH